MLVAPAIPSTTPPSQLFSLRIAVFKLAHGVWRRRREAASAAALYSVYHGLYSEAVVSSVASAVELAEVGRLREAVEYVQKAAKALYEAAKEVFERVKVAVQRLVELLWKPSRGRWRGWMSTRHISS